MSRFRFVTEWRFDSPIDRVWALLNEPEGFPRWWPGFEQAKTISGDGEVGSVTQYRVRGDFGLIFDFTTEVEETQAPEYLRLKANGDLSGTGEWRLRTEEGRTEVTYVWEVEVRQLWLRLLGMLPGSRRFMERSHNRVMTAGGANLARLLEE